MKKPVYKPISFCLLIALFFVFAYQTSAASSENIFYKMGTLEKSAQTYGVQHAAFQGDTIVIDAEELRVLTEKKKLIGKTNAEELAVQSLLKREALYQLAVAAGYEAADEDVLAKIDEIKAVYNNPNTMGREDITAWAAGAGMTPDEYLDSLYNQYKKELTTNLYTEPIYESYAAERGIVQWSYEEYEPWQEYLMQIASDYIEQDNVVDKR